MELLSEMLTSRLTFEVNTKPSSAVLSFMNLVAGLEQSIKLVILGGSFHFPKDSSILIKCTKYLRMRVKGDASAATFEREILIKLVDFKSFEERTIDLEAICDLTTGRKDDKQIEQKASLIVPWSRNDIHIPLYFTPALSASCRLHSSGNKKFLQVIIKTSCERTLALSNATMTCASDGVTITDINPKKGEGGEGDELIITKNVTISYLYELQVEPLKTENELPVIQVDYVVQYADVETAEKRPFNCTFDVKDYTTLFRIDAKIEQTELCRIGTVCHLHLTIKRMHENPFHDLMYEVLADQNYWAVCGRTAGVISLTHDTETVSLDVMPLSAGFLPLPNIRISKYIAAGQNKTSESPRLLPFQPGQVYNATKSHQVQVLATSNNAE